MVMEGFVEFLSSKTFIAFVILVVLYNVVRRYSTRVNRRTSRSQDRLRDAIRQRQITAWDEDKDDRGGAGPS